MTGRDLPDLATPARRGALGAMARAGRAFTALVEDVAGTFVTNEVERRRFAEQIHGHVAGLDSQERDALLHMALANLLVLAGAVDADDGYYTTLLERRATGR